MTILMNSFFERASLSLHRKMPLAKPSEWRVRLICSSFSLEVINIQWRVINIQMEEISRRNWMSNKKMENVFCVSKPTHHQSVYTSRDRVSSRDDYTSPMAVGCQTFCTNSTWGENSKTRRFQTLHWGHIYQDFDADLDRLCYLTHL